MLAWMRIAVHVLTVMQDSVSACRAHLLSFAPPESVCDGLMTFLKASTNTYIVRYLLFVSVRRPAGNGIMQA